MNNKLAILSLKHQFKTFYDPLNDITWVRVYKPFSGLYNVYRLQVEEMGLTLPKVNTITQDVIDWIERHNKRVNKWDVVPIESDVDDQRLYYYEHFRAVKVPEYFHRVEFSNQTMIGMVKGEYGE